MTERTHSRPAKVDRIEFIDSVVARKSVLHLGCTNYPYTQEAIDSGMLLHDRISGKADEVYGFDQDERGLEVLRERGTDNLFRADLEKLRDVDLEKHFDTIIAGEIIEHLSAPGDFLDGVRRFMSDSSKLVITTVNAYCALRFAVYALRGKGGISEPVHPDHVAYYSYGTLHRLLEKHGMEVEAFYFYDLGAEHRKFNPWYYNLVNDLAVAIFPQLSDGVIAVCRLKDG